MNDTNVGVSYAKVMKVIQGSYQMVKLRKYGRPPFSIAVIHGGPGALGGMAPVANRLAVDFGVLEPIQTADSLKGQLQELHDILAENAELPVALLGYSWGAFLSFVFAARYPTMVKKLILISSGPFEQQYSEKIMDTRLQRLREDQQSEVMRLISELNDPHLEDKDTTFEQIGRLLARADAYNIVTTEEEKLKCQYHIYQTVWNEADNLRKSGELLNLGHQIKCPVVSLHGDYDPHPAEGVKKPLMSVLTQFKFILLEKCGHTPWEEIEAQDKFYSILKAELSE